MTIVYATYSQMVQMIHIHTHTHIWWGAGEANNKVHKVQVGKC